jgi:transcriptional regulator with XRE-family HTH domain
MPALDPDSVIFALGRRLAELREQRGITQEQLAEQAEVSVKYLQRLESGQENLTIRSVVKFANLLRVRVPALFTAPSRAQRRPGRPAKKKT